MSGVNNHSISTLLILFIFLIFSLEITIIEATDTGWKFNIICTNKKASEDFLYDICSLGKACSDFYNIPFVELSSSSSSSIEENTKPIIDSILTQQQTTNNKKNYKARSNFNKIVKRLGIFYPLSVYLSDSTTTTTTTTTTVKSLSNNDNSNNDPIDYNNIEVKTVEWNGFQNSILYKIWSKKWVSGLSRLSYIQFINDTNPSTTSRTTIINDRIVSTINENRLKYSSIGIKNLVKDYQSMVNIYTQNDYCFYLNDSSSSSSKTYLTSPPIPLFRNFIKKQIEKVSLTTKTTTIEDLLVYPIIDVTQTLPNDMKVMNFVISTLHALEFYKIHLMMNETCINKNEKLFYDEATDRILCICMDGKDCDTESNTNSIVLMLSIFSTVLAILVSGAIIYSTTTVIDNSSNLKSTRYIQ